jgi:signal transduction histidine kinase
MSSLKFKISSALKDIIGRDLITDDNIAVFELVKNSFDAYATKVDIYFENIYSDNSKITITDNGKGMNIDDLQSKWLFVAYSAKREGTEDESFDYRDEIYQNRAFAGAKGIGRFSCDRLGSKLKLVTTKKEVGAKTELLNTNWEEFEDDLKDEFVNINVDHKTLKENHSHGTALEITDLRSKWDRNKLIILKDSLAKLINPNKGKSDQNFEIILHVPEEFENDSLETDERKIINGKIENFIFETLGLKTTKIISSISKDGKFITTELLDGNKLIYKIKEKNTLTLINEIDITLFYLNRSAKLTFAKQMGLASRKFGNIFLYKNGFRIFPFGEPGEDPLKLDERKSRKRYSYLGIDELIGQIQISGKNPLLKETSSRGNGLIINKEYECLRKYFNSVLIRLENYVVKVQEWGLSFDDQLDEYDDHKIKNRIGEHIANLTDAEDIIDFEYSNDFFEIIKDSQSGSAISVVENLKRIALNSNDEKLIKEAKRTENKLIKLIAANEDNSKLSKSLTDELNEKQSENLFLKSIRSSELEDMLNLMHHIGISTSTIQQYIKGVVFRIDEGINIENKELKKILNLLSLEVNKIRSISRYATRANFKISAKAEKIDLLDFIREYLNNIVKPFLTKKIDLKVLIDEKDDFVMEFKPLELTILLDNLVSNSKKANATLITISLKRIDRNTLIMKFKDNGIGIPENHKEKIFDYGFTTSDGSGMGLSHVKEILEKQNATISLANGKNGAEFIIYFKRF